MSKNRYCGFSSRRGTTAIEFAIIAPIAMLTLFAGIEFVRANVIRNTAENAAYAASRSVIVPGATKQEAIEEAERVLAMAGVTGMQIEFVPELITEETSFVTTRITVPMDTNSWGAAVMMRGTNIFAETTLRTERAPADQSKTLPTVLNPPPEPEPEPEPTPTPEPVPTMPTPNPLPPLPQPLPTPSPPKVLL